MYIYNVAGVSGQHFPVLPDFVKNINILEFYDYIWNHLGKCIQTSTNMPGTALVGK